MTTHDPYSGIQITFERTDRTGRYSPLVEDDMPNPLWMAAAGAFGALITVCLALAVWAAQ